MMGEGLAFIAAGVNRFINANKLNWNPQKKTPWVNTNLENKLNSPMVIWSKICLSTKPGKKESMTKNEQEIRFS